MLDLLFGSNLLWPNHSWKQIHFFYYLYFFGILWKCDSLGYSLVMVETHVPQVWSGYTIKCPLDVDLYLMTVVCFEPSFLDAPHREVTGSCLGVAKLDLSMLRILIWQTSSYNSKFSPLFLSSVINARVAAEVYFWCYWASSPNWVDRVRLLLIWASSPLHKNISARYYLPGPKPTSRQIYVSRLIFITLLQIIPDLIESLNLLLLDVKFRSYVKSFLNKIHKHIIYAINKT